MTRNSFESKAVVMAVFLLLFITAAIYLMRFSPAKGYLTTEQMERFLEAAGFWAPVMFVVIYAVGICLFVPGTL